jgi:hypothetical protein
LEDDARLRDRTWRTAAAAHTSPAREQTKSMNSPSSESRCSFTQIKIKRRK